MLIIFIASLIEIWNQGTVYEAWDRIKVLTKLRRLTLLHSEKPKLYAILAFLSAIGLSFGASLGRLPITKLYYAF